MYSCLVFFIVTCCIAWLGGRILKCRHTHFLGECLLSAWFFVLCVFLHIFCFVFLVFVVVVMYFMYYTWFKLCSSLSLVFSCRQVWDRLKRKPTEKCGWEKKTFWHHRQNNQLIYLLFKIWIHYYWWHSHILSLD